MGKELNVSKETIYTCIYVFCKGKLKKELIACIKFHKKSRLLRSRGKDRKFLIYEVFRSALEK